MFPQSHAPSLLPGASLPPRFLVQPQCAPLAHLSSLKPRGLLTTRIEEPSFRASQEPLNKLPQIWRLQTTEVSSLTVLEASSPKSRGEQGCASSEGAKENPCCSSSFWWLQGLLGLWQHKSSLLLCLQTAFSPAYPFITGIRPNLNAG